MSPPLPIRSCHPPPNLFVTACGGTAQPTPIPSPTAQVTTTPKPAPPPAPAKASDYVPPPCAATDCDGQDFKTQQEAQEFFIWAGGPAQDPHRLDADRDGIACESLPRR
ncbi:MAG: excalibur calcium-binding domain-containing protein [Dehalococcoidia bacterium]|nr:excalibur calcium-binding domain-containing protein [Dehalococcoidia bacterium]